MDSKPDPLHILFFPHLAHGHMIPTIDMARLFARQGVRSTILTTQLNAPFFSKTIERERKLGLEIDILFIKFPSMESGLPEGIENISSITSQEMGFKLFKAVSLLQQPLQRILKEHRPDCLVADAMFPWATEVAKKQGIPRLVFNGTSYFACCVFDSFMRYEPLKNVTSDDEPFEVPGIPDKIKMTRLQLAVELKESSANGKATVLDKLVEAEIRSSGVIMNSFQELEPAYVEHYKKTLGRKTWHIGPLSLCNNDDIEHKSKRGNANSTSIDRVECLRWLDSKKHNSVLYICFGSVSWISAAQLNEIAKGIEASGVDFIWVVRNTNKDEAKEEDWLPKGFEEKMKGKGLIIRGWAPQVMILDHEATGGFMTHCGWNSIMESITAGVPMVTWPLSNEQFCNEKLVTDVVRIGVGVGAQEWSRWMEGKKLLVPKENIIKAITEVMMAGEEGENMRNRASELKRMAKRAVEEGGSSNTDLKALLHALRLNNI